MASSDLLVAKMAEPTGPVRTPHAPVPSLPGPSDEEWVRLVGKCFGQLDESHRRVLTLRMQFNLSYEEIAAELQTQAVLVRDMVRRARENLRTSLARHSPEFSQSGESLPSPAG